MFRMILLNFILKIHLLKVASDIAKEDEITRHDVIMQLIGNFLSKPE